MSKVYDYQLSMAQQDPKDEIDVWAEELSKLSEFFKDDEDDWDLASYKPSAAATFNNYNYPVENKAKKCVHLWKPTLLLTSTVYNCKHCGIKKEEA